MISTRKLSPTKTPRSSGPSGPSYPASIQDTALNAAQRERALEETSSTEGLDVLIVGGSVTGAGIALDAAARGLRTGIAEMGDWVSGTSSWSSKLVHGDLCYLYQLSFALVHEVLTERGCLLSTTAPHLVKAQPFLWPLKHHYERSYSAVDAGMYDTLTLAGSRGRKIVPIQRHLGRKDTSALAPSLDISGLVGSIRFFDAHVDDARLAIDLVHTVVGLGALAANHTKVTGFLVDEHGHVHGARVTDLAAGTDHEIRAKRTINAAGVQTEDIQDLATDAGGLKVLVSKGIHIVIPKEATDVETGVFLRIEKSVLLIILWPEYWVIGTTDILWDLDASKSVATATDVDYTLGHANSVLSRPVTRANIIGVYAGLCPLLQPKLKPGAEATPTKVSRERTVTRVAPGPTAIADGKPTIYRVMASDAVDHALGEALSHAHSCATQELPPVGAAGYHALAKWAGRITGERGWTLERVTHLLDRRSDETPALLGAIGAAGPEERLGEPLEEAPTYLRAEVVWAVTYEGAESLDDVLLRRVCLDLSHRDRDLAAAGEILVIMAPLLNWSEKDIATQKEAYAQRVAQIVAAGAELTDAAVVTHITKPI